MDVSRNDMLGELANDAALERTDFVVQATEQLAKFLDRHRGRVAALGGLTLIDDDPDYLSIAPDMTFRVRSRFEDPDTGEWTTDTEIVETASELVELYNPVEIHALVRRGRARGRRPGGRADRDGRADGCGGDRARGDVRAGRPVGDDAYAGAADSWAAGQPAVLDADDEEGAALALYNLALDFQERSQQSEASLIEQFEEAAARVTGQLGDLIIVDDEDERLVLGGTGGFRAEVLPEDSSGEWRELAGGDELVEFYDPTDVFGDLADALAEAYPAIAPDSRPRPARAPMRSRTPWPPRMSRTSRPRTRTRRRTVAPDRRSRHARRRRRPPRAMRTTAAELVERREIMPGHVAPCVARAVGSLGRPRGPVRPPAHDGAGRAARPTAVADRHGGSGERHADDPGARRATVPRLGRRAAGRGRRRSRRAAGAAVRGGLAVATPAADRRGRVAGGAAAARRRGDPRRAVRRAGVRGAPTLRRSTRRACSRTRWSTSSRPRTGRWAIAGPCWTSSSTTRPGPTSRSRRVRRRCSGRWPRWRWAVGVGWASRRSGGSAAAGGR